MALTVRRRGESLTLRLAADPTGARAALARGGGHALSYEGEAPEGLASDLGALRARFEARAAHQAPEEALRAAVAEVWPDASVDEAAAPLPRWPSTLRIGSPPADSIWPFDAETLGLAIGARRLVKREQFSALAAERDAAWLQSRGLRVTPPGPPDVDGRRVIFAARDEADLREAHALEAQLRRDDGASHEAGRRLGEALGYPDCCVEAYAAVEARDDRGLAEALLPPWGAPPASPLTQWLSAPLGLVSHAPCALDCEATRALAQRLLEGLEAETPGFAARWRDLARRVHLLSHRRALALAVQDDRVARATELTVPRAEALAGWVRSADEWVGRALAPAPERAASASLTIDGERFLVADHRG